MVDTIIGGDVRLTVPPVNLAGSRIDIVYVRRMPDSDDVVTGVLTGTASSKPLPPALAVGMRKLAELHLTKRTQRIMDRNIFESEK